MWIQPCGLSHNGLSNPFRRHVLSWEIVSILRHLHFQSGNGRSFWADDTLGIWYSSHKAMRCYQLDEMSQRETLCWPLTGLASHERCLQSHITRTLRICSPRHHAHKRGDCCFFRPFGTIEKLENIQLHIGLLHIWNFYSSARTKAATQNGQAAKCGGRSFTLNTKSKWTPCI